MTGASAEAREKLLDAGARLLQEDSLTGLERLLSRDQLAKASSLSRDTAFRAFKSGAEVVEAVAEWISSTSRSGFDDALTELVGRYRRETSRADSVQLKEKLKEMLQLNLLFQFQSPGTPAGWVVQAAALTSSLQWNGLQPTEAQRELGQRLIAIRREYYSDMTRRLAETIGFAMSQLGRRPRRGTTRESIVTLMQSLSDGLALRLFIDPDAVDIATAAEATFELAWAFTEPGPEVDERRPAEEMASNTFDRVLETSIQLWARSSSVTLTKVAKAAGVDESVLSTWFGNLGGLADSAVRSLIATQGLPKFEEVTKGEALLELLGGYLNWVLETSNKNRNLFATAREEKPETSTPVLDDLAESIGDWLDRLTRCREPQETARRLIGGAVSQNRDLVTAIIEAIGV